MSTYMQLDASGSVVTWGECPDPQPAPTETLEQRAARRAALNQMRQMIGGQPLTDAEFDAMPAPVFAAPPGPPEGWVLCPAESVPHLRTGATWDGTTLIAPVDTRPKHITVLAFTNRFTSAERVALRLASVIEPGMTTQAKALAAALQDHEAQTNRATHIDLSLQPTRALVQSLEGLILAAGRAAEIFDAPIREHERFRGAV